MIQEEKTTFQNWVDKKFESQSEMLKDPKIKKAKITQSKLSRDYNSKHGLEKINFYGKILRLKHIEFSGFDYDSEISGTLKIR